MPALFKRAARGKYDKYNSVYSVVFGESGYLLEDELNEMQSNLLERDSSFANSLVSSGFLNDFTVRTTAYDNIFYIDTVQDCFNFMLMGLPLSAGANTVSGQPAGLTSQDNKLIFKLNSPPTSGTRTDLVILETWNESRSYVQGITKFGGESTPLVNTYEIIDQRINAETSRRLQWRWRIRVIDNETLITNVKAFNYLGQDTTLKYQSVGSNYIVSPGKILSANSDYISDGNIYALPLFKVTRRANDPVIVAGDVVSLVGRSTINDSSLPSTLARSANVYSKAEADSTFIKGGTGGGGATIGGNLVVNGDLTVNGATTTVNTQNLFVADNIITINSDMTTGTPTEHAGIEIKRGSLATVSVRWNETSDVWELTNDGTNFFKIATSGTAGAGTGVDADLLDGQHGSYYTNPANIVQTATYRFVSDTEKSTWNTKQDAITGAASSITFGNLTLSRAIVSDSGGKIGVSTTTAAELGYLSGVTSAVQTQLNAKQATITGAASTVASSNLTINRATISDSSGKIAASTTTATELGYLSGVTSSVQTQLGTKLQNDGSVAINNAAYLSAKNSSGAALNIAGIDATNKVLFGNAALSTYLVATSAQSIFANIGSTAYKIFNEGFMGSSSGLDADLLDGKHLSEVWANISGTRTGDLGFTPATAGGNVGLTFTSATSLTNDSAFIRYYDDNNTYAFWGDTNENSTLLISVGDDARTTKSDVLVLKSTAATIADAPEFRVMSGTTGYMTIQPTTSYTQFTTDRSYFNFNKDVKITGQIYAGPSNDQTVWHAGNDGVGSGLDADLLGGIQSANYMQITSSNRKGTTKLYRSDSDADYSVQVIWDGTRWQLNGYNGSVLHAGVRVDYADNAGTASTATTATTAADSTRLGGVLASSYMRSDIATSTSSNVTVGGYLRPSTGNTASNGISFAPNATGDTTYIRSYTKSADAIRLELGVTGETEDDMLFTSSGPIYFRSTSNYIDASNNLLIAGNISGATMNSTGTLTAGAVTVSGTTTLNGGLAWNNVIQGNTASYMNKFSSADGLNYTIITQDARVYRAVYNDLAELFLKSENTEPGDIIVMEKGKVRKSTKSLDKRVVGVHSDTYGFCLGGENKENPSDNYDKYTPIGISGRVLVKLTGDVEEGDLIVSSDIPGVGVKSDQYLPGTVIGKALETVTDRAGIYRAWVLIVNI